VKILLDINLAVTVSLPHSLTCLPHTRCQRSPIRADRQDALRRAANRPGSQRVIWPEDAELFQNTSATSAFAT